MRPLFFTLISMMTAAPALAQDSLGSIEARIDDTFRTWHLTRDGSQSQSSWIEKGPGITDVSLWGHDTPDTTSSVAEALILDFAVMTGTGTPMAINPTLQYLSEGYKGGWLAIDDSQITVTLESFDITPAGLNVAGSLSATLSYSTNPMAQTIDPTRSQPVEGRFAAILPPH